MSSGMAKTRCSAVKDLSAWEAAILKFYALREC
jgi:hypothetical protein